MAQASLLAYFQVRDIERQEEKANMVKAMSPANLLGALG
jgi:hypothetical protein